MFSGNPLVGLVPGGAIFMQSHFTNPADVWQRIPPRDKNTIREKNLRVYFIDMVQIAREVASEADLQMRMQGIVLLGAFLEAHALRRDEQHEDEAVYAGVEKALRKVLRQARRASGAGQPQLREARIQRDARNSAGDHAGRERESMRTAAARLGTRNETQVHYGDR